MDSIDKYIQIKKEEVGFVAAHLDGYDGILALRTPDPTKTEISTLHIMLSPNFQNEYEQLINSLEGQIWLKKI